MSSAPSFKEIEHRGSIIKVAREDNTWLGVVDLNGHTPVRLTIEKIVEFKNAKFRGGRTESGQAIKFVNAKKFLKLNATNAERLQRFYGTDDAEKLKGQQVILDIEQLERVFQGHTHGIRLQDPTKVA